MKNEQAFKKLLIRIRVQAKKQDGFILEDTVRQMLPDMELSEEEFQLVIKYLGEAQITVVSGTEEDLDSIRKAAEAETEEKERPGSAAYDLYIKELGELGEIGEEERLKKTEQALADRATVHETIPLLYLREVVDVAKLYGGQGVSAEDLIGEGNISLLTGAKMLECCDTAKEAEEFLVKMIMDAMESLLMEKSSEDELDLKVLERVNDLNEKAKELAETVGREV
ncbi:MAG TPA: RNA polymerase sigma factor region1.1 domain-containing protein, partial [Lachnospiraceae bacterium]|nr:RNA polymerase sigma factor region1.1 domain-containing protein [Lachnospiraceae bacterium]